MDSSDIVIWEIIILMVLILANGIFAMTELALVSARVSRLTQLAEEGSNAAKLALRLAEEPTALFSAVQVGITLIGIVTGAFGGATLTGVVAEKLQVLPWIGSHSHGIAFVVVIGCITYFSLIFGELLPKKLAVNHAESVAVSIAYPMYWFSKSISPLVSFLSGSTHLFGNVLGLKERRESTVTEEEVKIIVDQGAESGALEKYEQDMVHRVFRLDDIKASSIMTPRTQLVWIDLTEPLEDNLDLIASSGHSRFPVAKDSLDDFIGVLHSKDILAKQVSGEAWELEILARRPLFVPKSMPGFKLLEMFKEAGLHEAMVLDEYGGVVGMITLHDLLEEIIGDMPQIDEDEDPQIIQRADGSWLLDGMLAVDEFKKMFGFKELPEEDRDDFHTLGGFVISYLGYIPAAAEGFEWGGLKFEVMDMDRARVDKVLVTQLPSETAVEPES